MTISVVQDGEAGAAGGTWAVTLGSGTTAGNTLFYVATAYENTGAVPSSSAPLLGGSAVTGAVKLIDVVDTSSDRLYTSIWMLPDVPGGKTACAITMTNSQSINNVGLTVYEVAGLGSSPSLDRSSSGNSASTPTTAVSSGTTAAITAAPEFVLGAASIDRTRHPGRPGSRRWRSAAIPTPGPGTGSPPRPAGHSAGRRQPARTRTGPRLSSPSRALRGYRARCHWPPRRCGWR